MTQEFAGAQAHQAILEQFVADVCAAADPAAFVETYSRRHPELHTQFVLELFQFQVSTAASPEQLLGDFVRRYPHLHGELGAIARIERRLADLAAPSDREQPEQLGDFRILRRIAEGGMGQVYEAIQAPLQRRVAVKVVRRKRISVEMRDRFLREQRVLAQLHQTHIVPIYAAGEQDSLQYFAMPYIAGAPLHHLIASASTMCASTHLEQSMTFGQMASAWVRKTQDRNPMLAERTPQPVGTTAPRFNSADAVAQTRVLVGDEAIPAAAKPMPPHEYFRSAAQVMLEIADAVEHAHAADILHRDLKPSNIMVDTDGQAWVIDFGLAAMLADGPSTPASAAGSDAPASLLSASGVMGTPAYMAPEQFQGKADVCTDVWGLGVVFYELLAFRRAFTCATNVEIAQEVMRRTPDPPHQSVANVPRDLEAICLKAMQKDPRKRYPNARRFSADLARWLNNEPVEARPAHVWRRVGLWSRRHPGWATALVTAMLAVTTLVGLWLRHEQARAENAQANEREQRRAALLVGAQAIRVNDRVAGWSEEVWEAARAAATIRPGGDAQQQATGSLVGIDARLVKRFTFGGTSVAFDETGRRLLVGGYGSTPKRWDRELDQVQPVMCGGQGPVLFDRDGRAIHLAIDAGNWKAAVVWSLDSETAVRKFILPAAIAADPETGQRQAVLALSPDGTLAAASTLLEPDARPVTLVWQIANGKTVYESPSMATAIAFTADNATIALGDTSGNVTVHATSGGQLIAELRGERSRINALTFHRDPQTGHGKPADAESKVGWLLACGDDGGTTTIWSLARRLPQAYCRGRFHGHHSAVFSTDGTMLATGGHSTLAIWDVATGRLLLDLWHVVNSNSIDGLAFSKDDRSLAFATSGPATIPVVGVVDLDYGRGLRTLPGLDSSVYRVKFSIDGRFLSGFATNWKLAVWDAHTGRLLRIFQAPVGYFTDSADWDFSPDGNQVCFAAGTRAVVWELNTGREVRTWSVPPGLQDNIVYHPSGRLLLARFETKSATRAPFASAHSNDHPRVVRVRDLVADQPNKPLIEISHFDRHVLSVVLPGAGEVLSVCGINGNTQGSRDETRLYDPVSGKELLRIDQYTSRSSWDSSGRHFMAGMNSYASPSGKFLGPLPPGSLGALSGDARLRIGIKNPSGIPPVTADLHAVDPPRLLATIGLDAIAVALPVFDPSNRFVAWGDIRGTVTLADLVEVQERLAGIGLGW